MDPIFCELGQVVVRHDRLFAVVLQCLVADQQIVGIAEVQEIVATQGGNLEGQLL